jgi:hypothetical protein
VFARLYAAPKSEGGTPVATVPKIGDGSCAEPLLPQAFSTPKWLDESHFAGRCSVAESHGSGRNSNGAGNAATQDMEVTWSFGYRER